MIQHKQIQVINLTKPTGLRASSTEWTRARITYWNLLQITYINFKSTSDQLQNQLQSTLELTSKQTSQSTSLPTTYHLYPQITDIQNDNFNVACRSMGAKIGPVGAKVGPRAVAPNRATRWAGAGAVARTPAPVAHLGATPH